MVNISGTANESDIVLQGPGLGGTDELLPYLNLSSNAGSTPPLPLGGMGLIELGALDPGALTLGAPVSPSASLSGSRQFSFLDDFYNRFCVTPGLPYTMAPLQGDTLQAVASETGPIILDDHYAFSFTRAERCRSI